MTPLWASKFEIKPGTWVFVPTADTIKSGKEIKYEISKRWRAPKNYYHLREGGHVGAIQSHLANTFFCRVDIQNFFGSINRSRITRCLKDLFDYNKAREITNLSTVIHPDDKCYVLPFGFVQSPILASLCLSKSALGNCIQSLNKKYGITVSVYVDDLIFSSNDKSELEKAFTEISRCALRSNFTFNSDKVQTPTSQITAFNIDLTHASMKIESARLSKFIEVFNNSESEYQRRGIESYIRSVNPTQALPFI
jgi:RNase P protein component